MDVSCKYNGAGNYCYFTPKVCNDKNACTTDKCVNGKCTFTPKKCDDANKCTTDSCDPKTGTCKNVAIVCDDGNP
jgi:hypothetical protein